MPKIDIERWRDWHDPWAVVPHPDAPPLGRLIEVISPDDKTYFMIVHPSRQGDLILPGAVPERVSEDKFWLASVSVKLGEGDAPKRWRPTRVDSNRQFSRGTPFTIPADSGNRR